MAIKVGNVAEIRNLQLFILEDDLDLRLFKNNIVLTDLLVTADFTEANFVGYAQENLVAGTWVFTGGAPGIADYGDVVFTSTGGGQSQIVYGYYVVQRSSGLLMWAERFDDNDPTAPYTIVNIGDTITVPLAFEAKDTTE